MISQELHILLIKLKLQRMLLQNLQGDRETEAVSVTAGSCPPVMATLFSSAYTTNYQQDRTPPVLRGRGGGSFITDHTQSRQEKRTMVPIQRCEVAKGGEDLSALLNI